MDFLKPNLLIKTIFLFRLSGHGVLEEDNSFTSMVGIDSEMCNSVLFVDDELRMTHKIIILDCCRTINSSSIISERSRVNSKASTTSGDSTSKEKI